MLKVTEKRLIAGTKIISGTPEDVLLCLPAVGGGIYIPELIYDNRRYLTFFAEAQQEHSVALNLLIYGKKDPEGAPVFNLRFGIMPKVKALICIDLNWLDGHVLFPGHNEGQLKVVCHGRRVEKSEIASVVLSNYPCFHDIKLRLSSIGFSSHPPENYPLPDIKLIDSLGQLKTKQWPGKMKNSDELRASLNKVYNKLGDGYSISDWDEYGGWKKKKLTEGTGYFTKAKKDGRWWLADPLGNAFFSVGPDCVAARADCRVDGVEKFMDWLPEKDDPVYGRMYDDFPKRMFETRHRNMIMFSFEQANLYRAFGSGWYEKWKKYIVGQLKQNGMNTLGLWSDSALYGSAEIPYVTALPRFPTTEAKIFRDFPDVFSAEYEKNSKEAASFLKKYKNDPYMIGYFLGNEPAWAFVEHLVLADEVLRSSEKTACKKELVKYLIGKYGEVDKLNTAWGKDFASFDDLYKPQKNVSGWSGASCKDMMDFSKKMLEAYIAIPSDACRRADPNHMNLGLRWAWISDENIVTGWRHFDVFSINCYATDPTEALDNVRNLNVDLPVIIGEFHFGALDAGLTATGLEAVATQEDRGTAFRTYCEKAAAHPNGVGCHYFQCYDQFALGRFDGENYNIGLFDICSIPYERLMKAITECGGNIYEVANGAKKPYDKKPKSIPMIAY